MFSSISLVNSKQRPSTAQWSNVLPSSLIINDSFRGFQQIPELRKTALPSLALQIDIPLN